MQPSQLDPVELAISSKIKINGILAPELDQLRERGIDVTELEKMHAEFNRLMSGVVDPPPKEVDGPPPGPQPQPPDDDEDPLNKEYQNQKRKSSQPQPQPPQPQQPQPQPQPQPPEGEGEGEGGEGEGEGEGGEGEGEGEGGEGEGEGEGGEGEGGDPGKEGNPGGTPGKGGTPGREGEGGGESGEGEGGDPSGKPGKPGKQGDGEGGLEGLSEDELDKMIARVKDHIETESSAQKEGRKVEKEEEVGKGQDERSAAEEEKNRREQEKLADQLEKDLDKIIEGKFQGDDPDLNEIIDDQRDANGYLDRAKIEKIKKLKDLTNQAKSMASDDDGEGGGQNPEDLVRNASILQKIAQQQAAARQSWVTILRRAIERASGVAEKRSEAKPSRVYKAYDPTAVNPDDREVPLMGSNLDKPALGRVEFWFDVSGSMNIKRDYRIGLLAIEKALTSLYKEDVERVEVGYWDASWKKSSAFGFRDKPINAKMFNQMYSRAPHGGMTSLQSTIKYIVEHERQRITQSDLIFIFTDSDIIRESNFDAFLSVRSQLKKKVVLIIKHTDSESVRSYQNTNWVARGIFDRDQIIKIGARNNDVARVDAQALAKEYGVDANGNRVDANGKVISDD